MNKVVYCIYLLWFLKYLLEQTYTDTERFQVQLLAFGPPTPFSTKEFKHVISNIRWRICVTTVLVSTIIRGMSQPSQGLNSCIFLSERFVPLRLPNELHSFKLHECSKLVCLQMFGLVLWR